MAIPAAIRPNIFVRIAIFNASTALLTLTIIANTLDNCAMKLATLNTANTATTSCSILIVLSASDSKLLNPLIKPFITPLP